MHATNVAVALEHDVCGVSETDGGRQVRQGNPSIAAAPRAEADKRRRANALAFGVAFGVGTAYPTAQSFRRLFGFCWCEGRAGRNAAQRAASHGANTDWTCATDEIDELGSL